MFKGTFALVNRSLRSDDRLLSSHLFRLLFVGLSYGMLLSSQQRWLAFGAPGLHLFRHICYLNFFGITLAAVSFFATAISEEKEDMTLGLLKMAGVTPLALLLGKSTPRLVTAIVLLTAQLPFTMLAITLGGVSLGQVLAAYVALLAYLVLVANLALLFSVLNRSSRGAGVMTGAALAVFFFGPLVISAAQRGLVFAGYLSQGGIINQSVENSLLWVGRTSAFRRLGGILSTGFSESPISMQVSTNLVAGVGFLITAWLVFERATRNERPASEPRGLLFRRIGGHGILGPNRAWPAALVWKDFHFVAGGKMTILAKFLIYGCLLALFAGTIALSAPARSFRLRDFGQMTMMLGLWALMLELGVQASRVYYVEAKWKTLSSIAMLPIPLHQIAYAKLLGCLMSLAPATFYLLLGITCAPDQFARDFGSMIEEPGFWYLGTQYLLFLHLAALLSLFVKWGAFPLAIASIYLGNFVLFTTIAVNSGPQEPMFVFFAIVTIVVCVLAHYLIGDRLRTLAAR